MRSTNVACVMAIGGLEKFVYYAVARSQNARCNHRRDAFPEIKGIALR